ncbi:kinase-like domain [Fusarium albosuccineum]|uniref:Kinase-like domain n=1 Tax=Fusarium albosuccineum TaxID=1237068 RepID=A0A8H4LAU5_9HYPO|nr:kinase-like domain [Fusarium albosuccineum]
MDSSFDDNRLLSYTDTEISDCIASLPNLPGYSTVTPLSSKYLSKGYRQDEFEDAAKSMEFASQLGIHVPRIRRTIEDDEGGIYCVMDRIPGTTLDEKWPELGWIASIRIAFQLRRIVRRLRSAQSTLAGSPVSGNCRSYFLEDFFELPPKASAENINAFLNFWASFINIRHEIKKTPAEHAICPNPIFLSTQPLVFTHHDLAPRNIILDPQGQLWLIDWDCAGFYPKFFEYAGMHNFIRAGWSKFTYWRWKLLAWIVGGFYDKERRWLGVIRTKFTRFSPARRFNMKANGYAAVAGRYEKD